MAEKKEKKESGTETRESRTIHAKGYSVAFDPEKTARARGVELPISRKKSMELCRELRGMELQSAKEYLEEVIAKKRAVPIRRYTTGAGHKKGGIGPGKYPVKVAKYVLKVIENAESNAEYIGLDTDTLYIKSIAAHPGRVYKGYMPRAHGRWTPWDEKTTNIEVILESMED